MNPYILIGSAGGTAEAASLSQRLAAWHDAMVAHERRLRAGRLGDECDDDCAHGQARLLWAEDGHNVWGPCTHTSSRSCDPAPKARHHRLRAAPSLRAQNPGRPPTTAEKTNRLDRRAFGARGHSCAGPPATSQKRAGEYRAATLRDILGLDAPRVHEQVDEVLDAEDTIIILIGRHQATSYCHGFALSGCQLELLSLEVERPVRALGSVCFVEERRNDRDEQDDSGAHAGDAPPGGAELGLRWSVADWRSQGDRSRDRGCGTRWSRPRGVLRTTSKASASYPG
jgi:hypothetical protein